MSTAIGFIAVISLVTIAIKELVIANETGINRNLKKFLNQTIFILVALFACLVIVMIIDILINK